MRKLADLLHQLLLRYSDGLIDPTTFMWAGGGNEFGIDALQEAAQSRAAAAPLMVGRVRIMRGGEWYLNSRQADDMTVDRCALL